MFWITVTVAGLIAWLLSVGFMSQTANEENGLPGVLGCILLPPVFAWYVRKEWPWSGFLAVMYAAGIGLAAVGAVMGGFLAA